MLSEVSCHIGRPHKEKGEMVVFVASFKYRVCPMPGAGRSKGPAFEMLTFELGRQAFSLKRTHPSCLAQAESQTTEDLSFPQGRDLQASLSYDRL